MPERIQLSRRTRILAFLTVLFGITAACCSVFVGHLGLGPIFLVAMGVSAAGIWVQQVGVRR